MRFGSPEGDRRHIDRSTKDRVLPPEKELLRYTKHGVAIVPVPVLHTGVLDSIHIGAADLQGVQQAWLKFAPDSVRVIISDGRTAIPSSHKPDGIVKIDPDQALEGFEVRLYYNVNPRRQIPYDARLEPLYRIA